MAAELTISDTAPPSPPNADFAFYIDFKRGQGSASKVFAATHEFIVACEKLDRELLKSVDSNIETVMVLEDVEVASLKTWLRNALVAADDDALKDLDWKKQVGKYLVKAKYIVLTWIDDDAAPRDLPALRKELHRLATETDVRHLPAYVPPSPDALIDAVRDFQGVKDRLGEGYRAKFMSDEGSVEMNLAFRWNVEDLEALAVKQTLSSPAMEMIIAVKKPDYLGASKWEFRHGRRTIQAKIEDLEWMRAFQGRRIDVRPGDALRCTVSVDSLYGHDNELIAERYVIKQVHEVLMDRFTQAELGFLDED